MPADWPPVHMATKVALATGAPMVTMPRALPRLAPHQLLQTMLVPCWRTTMMMRSTKKDTKNIMKLTEVEEKPITAKHTAVIRVATTISFLASTFMNRVLMINTSTTLAREP